MPFIPLIDAEVLAEVKRLTGANRISWTRHSEEMMADRGIDKGEVKECLKRGNFTERPHIPNRMGELQYAFRMEAVIESVPIAVAAALVPGKKIVVITLFDPTKFN